ncbi:MAG: peptidase U32 family protein [Lentisphaeria bacterium]
MDFSELEILAPAGGLAELEAAVEAGADAVYFGLIKLNARQGASNFAPEVLEKTLAFLHQHGVKGYLTLNIDLVQREIGLAARTLEAARQAKVDAVLIRDAALLELMPFFPELAFHFSTQAAISSSAGVWAAHKLGLKRVVLARELSAGEIRAASGVSGIETEVFVQGALCFSCSGRCLLSSWGGGHSGNRGTCTSPCRVPWKLPKGDLEHPLSMFDLCLAEQLPTLAACGVRSLKIEGRLKSPAWVRQAVTLYCQARKGTLDKNELDQQTTNLGAYSGRQLSSAFFTETRQKITGEAGRPSNPEWLNQSPEEAPKTHNRQLAISLQLDERQGTLWNFSWNEQKEVLRIPPQRIASSKRATSIQAILDELSASPPGNLKMQCICPEDLREKLLPRRCLKTVQNALQGFLRQVSKGAEGTVRISLPADLNAFLEQDTPRCNSNKRTLAELPDRLRLGQEELPWFREYCEKHPETKIVYTCIPTTNSSEQEYRVILQELAPWLAAVALPQVIYEDQLAGCRQLLAVVRKAGLTVEVNSWDTWQLAQEAGVTLEAGPGLAVLNANAARFLEAKGCRCVTISCEIDSSQLEELCQKAVTPLSLCVFARPPLMQTRVELPQAYAPENADCFEDSRKIVLNPRREGPLTVLRPQQPCDWRSLKNPRVRVAHLLLDVSGSANPAADLMHAENFPFLFNYDRKLR